MLRRPPLVLCCPCRMIKSSYFQIDMVVTFYRIMVNWLLQSVTYRRRVG